ncbi:MAG TPA: YpdA family putative bacillithiol disulfide reductase [Bryobacteraceae bacterium]|nr:YpdA family putative bacillithiol disulfide reductase [Bryobacteraceae bacterium]
MQRYDAVVVGAGPTGLACGIELKSRGVNSVLIDKGCVVNSLYNYPTHMVFFTTPELLEIGGLPMTSLNEKPGRTEALKYYRRVAEYYQLGIHQYERVLTIEGDDGDFRVKTSKSEYGARKIVLATGYYDVPNLLGVPGENLDKVIHYYKEPHPYYNHDVIVVGAKNSAAIAALELYWTGARVTLIHRGDRISDRVKYWIKPNIENRIKNAEIQAYFKSRIVEIKPQSVEVETPEGRLTLKNDFVFAMTGYRPDLEFLESIGIRLEGETQKPRTNPDTLESDRPGIFLAGVIVAGMHTNEIFIENGRFHGKKIAEAIAESLASSHRGSRPLISSST